MFSQELFDDLAIKDICMVYTYFKSEYLFSIIKLNIITRCYKMKRGD